MDIPLAANFRITHRHPRLQRTGEPSCAAGGEMARVRLERVNDRRPPFGGNHRGGRPRETDIAVYRPSTGQVIIDGQTTISTGVLNKKPQRGITRPPGVNPFRRTQGGWRPAQRPAKFLSSTTRERNTWIGVPSVTKLRPPLFRDQHTSTSFRRLSLQERR
jgi:hypothetical protein